MAPFADMEATDDKGLASMPDLPQLCPAARTNTPRPTLDIPIHRAVMPNGKRITLLKTMLTSVCENNCNYCAFRKDRDFNRQTFIPDELAGVFNQLWHSGRVTGLFLSSGVAGGGCRTMDRLLDTADILRNRIGFKGYLHLKLMPGAETAQVERAMQLADRVSLNLEAPGSPWLASLAPQKIFTEQLLQPLRWANNVRHNLPAWQGWNKHWPSSSTQFVVGGADETDRDLLKASEYLMHHIGLTRVYYSRFKPVSDTPLEERPAASPLREHRLYQASFLLRDYGYTIHDLDFSSTNNLPLDTDPKMAWAQRNLGDSPIEINRADYQELLRLPGIGPLGAKKIMQARLRHPLHHVDDLRAIGIHPSHALPFMLINGHRAGASSAQLSFAF